MDILNNIWTAISTPNEVLVNIFIAIVTIIIEAPLSFHFICNLFRITYTISQKLLYILSIGLIAIISSKFISWPFNIIINYLIAFLILFFILKLNFIKSLIATISPSIVFNLLGNLILNPYLTILNITYEQSMTILIYRLPFAFCMYIIVFLIILVLKHRKIVLDIFDDLDAKNKNILILNFAFGSLYILVQCILTINYIDILPPFFSFFNFVCLLIYFALSFFSLAKIMTLVSTERKLQNAEQYNKTLHILHDSVRGFKHDFDNIVTTIGGYIKTNDMDGLKNYYSQLEEDCKKVNNLYVLNPDIINNPGIYSLLTTKYSEAIEKQININLTFLLDLNELNMKIYEFARILGILLDNAIEAASECKEKILNIEFRNDSKNNRNIILIENTYNNKNINIDKIFNKGVTEKENHSGLGLWEIRQILKKNNNVNLHTTKNDKYFSQQLEIYY